MIREFQKSDAEAWCNIRKQNLLEVNSKNYPQEIITLLLCQNKPENVLKKIKTRLMLVYEKEKKILGTISLTKDGEIKNLFVKPELQRKGIGKKLLKTIEKSFEGKIFLYASTTAQKFYEKNGYKKEHEEVDEINGKQYKVMFMTKQV
ncbi:MAG: GNAT family N-acetyltransferase [Nanoarchaeota archaeon]|nr:GNAT family N-acetyltransferase [Nanoarchaeota archaeon]